MKKPPTNVAESVKARLKSQQIVYVLDENEEMMSISTDGLLEAIDREGTQPEPEEDEPREDPLHF